jgi:hypothetical protein
MQPNPNLATSSPNFHFSSSNPVPSPSISSSSSSSTGISSSPRTASPAPPTPLPNTPSSSTSSSTSSYSPSSPTFTFNPSQGLGPFPGNNSNSSHGGGGLAKKSGAGKAAVEALEEVNGRLEGLQRGAVYKRKTMHDRFGGQRQGGITTPLSCPFIFLFTAGWETNKSGNCWLNGILYFPGTKLKYSFLKLIILFINKLPFKE